MTNEQIIKANELKNEIDFLENEIEVMIDDMFLCNLIRNRKSFGIFASGRKVEFQLTKEDIRSLIDIRFAIIKNLKAELEAL